MQLVTLAQLVDRERKKKATGASAKLSTVTRCLEIELEKRSIKAYNIKNINHNQVPTVE